MRPATRTSRSARGAATMLTNSVRPPPAHQQQPATKAYRRLEVSRQNVFAWRDGDAIRAFWPTRKRSFSKPGKNRSRNKTPTQRYLDLDSNCNFNQRFRRVVLFLFLPRSGQVDDVL